MRFSKHLAPLFGFSRCCTSSHAIVNSVTDTISLSFAVDQAYDSQPPLGVDAAQTSYKTSLGIRF